MIDINGNINRQYAVQMLTDKISEILELPYDQQSHPHAIMGFGLDSDKVIRESLKGLNIKYQITDSRNGNDDPIDDDIDILFVLCDYPLGMVSKHLQDAFSILHEKEIPIVYFLIPIAMRCSFFFHS